MPFTTDDNFVAFCRQATDSQLEELLKREWSANRRRDYYSALQVANERGWKVRLGLREL